MKKLFLICTLLALVGCSSTPDVEESQSANNQAENDFDFSDPRDPFEDINRVLWDFNRDTLDPHLILPAANAYEKVPSPLRRGLYNMTDNLKEPASFVNNVLQLKMANAFITVGRFTLNSTVGLLGFFDVATPIGLEARHESFGETLAVYGVPNGPYIMLPGAGPTVAIDRGGDLVDDYVWPLRFLGWQWSAAQLAIRGLSQRIELKQLEPMLENSLDEYAFVREAYFSYWADKVYDGNPPAGSNMWDDGWDDGWDDEWEDEWNPSASVPFEPNHWRDVTLKAQREYRAPR